VAWTGASGGYVRLTGTKGASGRLTFSGRSVAVHGPRNSSLGLPAVYLDGVRVATMNQRSAADLLFYICVTAVEQDGSVGLMARTIGFRPTAEDERIIKAAMHPDEGTSDVIRRALRLLEREVWLAQARSDAEQLAAEDLSGEADAW
jgi:antitoxin ParD1/3/4